MSKSTPIAQLPTQKVSAVPSDILMDDDATVQEVLNQIAQTQSEPQVMQMTPQQHQMLYASNPQPREFVLPPAPPSQMHYAHQPVYAENPSNMYQLDFKTAGMIAIIALFIQVFPIEIFVNKYVALDTLPYGAVLVKAALAGVLYLVAKKYLL